MITTKPLIAIIFVSFALLSGVSCICSVSLPLRFYPSDGSYIPIYEESGNLIKFTPFLESYCTNTVLQTQRHAIESGAEDLGRSPFYKNGQQFRSNFLLGNSRIQASLNYTVFDNKDQVAFSELCFIKYLDKNDNIIDQLFKQGLIYEKKFYIDVKHIQHNTQAGSIDIGDPNYSLIKQGQQFTTLKPVSQLSQYCVDSNLNLTYGDLQLVGGSSVKFSLEYPFLMVSNQVIYPLQQEFEAQGILLNIGPNRYNTYVNSIQSLQDIHLDVIAEDESIYTITLKPEHYSRKISNGKYQLLLYPTFSTNTVTIGYAALQAYYVGFDFKSQKVMILEKQQNKINSQ